MPGRVTCLRSIIAAIALLCTIASAASFAFAESDIAVRGTITDDSTGNPVEQAIIRIEGTALSATSESDGSFEFRAVPLGSWSLMIERVGYRARRFNSVDIVEGFSRSLYIPLDPDPIILDTQKSEATSLGTHSARRITISPEQVGARSVSELLESIPGVRVYGSSDSPAGTRISVGGEPASRVAVMVDGLPLSGGSDGAVDLSSIPVSALTAIEVHSGSQSAIAGDAAVGGAVNLITRVDAQPNGIRLSTSGGDWGRTRQDIAVTRTLNRVTVSAGGEYDQRRNPYKFMEVKTDTTGWRQNARLDERRAYLRLSSASQRAFEMLGYASRNERGAPGTIELPLTAFTRNKNGRVQSSREIALTGSNRVTAAAWYEFSSEYYNAQQASIPQHSYLREHFVGVKVGHSTTLLSADWGSESETRYRLIHGEDFQRAKNSFGDEERAEYALRTRLSRHIWRFSLHGGIALDADAENAPGWSPRIDVGVRPVRSVVLGIGWGKSFKRPLLMTAFWKGDYQTRGNPALRPERASEWDARVRWRIPFLTIDTRYFERTIDDIVVWDLRGVPQKYTPVNLASGRVIGREDHAAVDAGDWCGIDYMHVFTDGVDQSGEVNYEGHTLVFTPRHTHDLSLWTSHKFLSVRVNGRWVTRRYTLRANTKWQGPYRAFDAEVRITPSSESPHVVVFIRVDNITNEPIELLQGYPSPARTLSAGLTVRLN